MADNKNQPPAQPAKKSQDDAELERRMQEEESARQAALAAAAQAAAKPKVAAAPVQQRPVRAGDIKVVALQNNPHVRMGGRDYNLKKGERLDMDPNHAEELEPIGWIIRQSR